MPATSLTRLLPLGMFGSFSKVGVKERRRGNTWVEEALDPLSRWCLSGYYGGVFTPISMACLSEL